MKTELYQRALAESENGLPEAFRTLPEGVRKNHVKTIVNDAWRKVIGWNHRGVTDLALLARSFTICYISEATANEMVVDILG